MTVRTQRILQQIILFAVIFAMLMAESSLVSFNVRLMMAGVALGAAVVICSRRLRDSNLLYSPLDFGWLPYIVLTGITILLAASPRRSLEVWLWLIGIQLPMAYGALYLFRRRWPERGLYRALLGAGGYLYLLSLVLTLNYVSQVLAARSAGVTPPGFRLFDILDHPNIFAMFISVATPTIIGYAFTPMRRIERIGVVLWLVGAALALFGTGSRNGTVALMVGSASAVVLALVAHPAHPIMRFRTWMTAHRSQAIAGIAAAAIVALIGVGIVIKLQFGRPLQDGGGGRISFYRSAIGLFVASPITGTGPGGFFRNQIQTQAAPPMPHAHDMVLSAAAESGLLGLIGFLALLAASVWTCYRVWRELPEKRALVAGPIGGLIGFAFNGILDSPINEFSAFFLAVVVLAYVASFLPAPKTKQPARTAVIVIAVWVVVLLVVVVLIPYTSLWAVMDPQRPPVTPAQTLSDAQKLDSVIAYDSTDPLVTLQSGYVWAAVDDDGDGGREALQNAIARFERGTQLDPDLGINWLNLSALYLKANRPADAAAMANRAVTRAPGDPVAWLNLGIGQEANGDKGTAQASYLKALTLVPYWQSAGFWHSSPTRQAALTQFSVPNDYYRLLAQANAARLAGRKAEALKLYQQALDFQPAGAAQPYIQGLVALTNGDSVAATKLLQRAVQSIGSPEDDPITYGQIWLALGDIARSNSNTSQMIRDYAQAYGVLASRSVNGFGSKGSWTYALVGYQRFARITDYVPEVVILDLTADEAPAFLTLAQATGDTGAIYRQLLQANPGIETF